MANAPRRFGDECFAKCCLGEAVIDCHSRAAAFHFARRGGVQRDTKIVQSTGPGQSCVQSSIEDTVAITQKVFHVFKGKTLQKILRSYARPRRKEPVKMKWAKPRTARQLGKVRLHGMVSIQIADHVCYSFVMVND